ncbi:hypothetical protein VOLCADRAFT_92089 [Volvox carteri f. nagariensis]|uniref:Uncharacterized protein n=1 Tax=Volvox carteri f. nagariensis TaxID=3068 RepID=D8TYK2_VOLCA|nr:uncharacterized protein VOLCADRAFT_92089 [Volvox carteri f. nagariensis]EFJ47325.1 hypothetical protein VOLCADRAFT_92089 [Volvox carteri f. nagariensis]|eukprot:XP_002951514.1 hypothetical protein VOLCADRAFT_92089 [Volvox carteri f. nagariensis]
MAASTWGEYLGKTGWEKIPCIPAYPQTCIPAYLHTCIPAYLHTCIPAYLHTCIPAYLHTCIPAYLHTCIPAYLHIPAHTCIQVAKRVLILLAEALSKAKDYASHSKTPPRAGRTYLGTQQLYQVM